MVTCPASYRDRAGEAKAVLEIAGTSLRIDIRGVPFAGNDFDSLEPSRPLSAAEAQVFVLDQHGCLCSFGLSWTMPVELLVVDRLRSAQLEVELELADPLPNGGLSGERLSLRLLAAGLECRSRTREWFEDAVADVQRELAGRAVLRVCFACAHSDYSPGGHGLWGGLACFRGNKAEYAAVRTKVELFRIWRTHTEMVAETHVCPECAVRVAGTGYRG